MPDRGVWHTLIDTLERRVAGALASLRTMVNVGFSQYEWLERTRCFEGLREDPEFASIVAAARENAGRRQGNQ